MQKILAFLYNYQSLIYKFFLFLLSTLTIVYLLPTKNQWAYEFSEGDLWKYEKLYAPFDFALIKSDEEIAIEKAELRQKALVFFTVDSTVYPRVIDRYKRDFATYFSKIRKPSSRLDKLNYDFGLVLLKEMYDTGVLPPNYSHQGGVVAGLISGKNEKDVSFDELIDLRSLEGYLKERTVQKSTPESKAFYNLFFDILLPNLAVNTTFTEKELQRQYAEISPTRDIVVEGQEIISPGQPIVGKRWSMLWSLRQQFASNQRSKANYYWTTTGYFLMIGMVLLILFMFIHQYRPAIYEDNTKVTFLFFNILLMVGASTSLLGYKSAYIYVLPVCIFPLITKAFFDARLGLFVHVITVTIVGFIVPNGFEYLVLQILAGMITILSASELYKRANLFISVSQITSIYLFGYLCFVLIKQGSITQIEPLNIGLFVIGGLLTLFVQPLIYLYEKIFKLVSDVSLLELSDTNSGLFKMLSDQAPGTFHHSLQVANLAEAAALRIGANALLTRVGALYHDIGKINRPAYFSENQRGNVSLHDELSPQESARIIINHVIEGIEKAKAYNIPDRIIDFIRTHHGTSTVYFFYKKAQAAQSDVSIEDFSYPGPKPFSKETAIVMMADAVEAATKSLVTPSAEELTAFVNKIIATQMEENQFINANITLAEIEMVKKVLIDKLINVYHLRIAYPE